MTASQQTWEEWNRRGGPRYPHEKIIQFCFRRFPRRDDRVGRAALDLGCGGGVHTVFLAEEGFTATGVDLAESAIESTRQKLAARGLEATLARQGLAELALPGSAFDLVVCVSVFDSAGPAASAEGLRRLVPALKPGACGLFLFAAADDFRILGSNDERLHGYRRDEVETLFQGRFRHVWIDEYLTTHEGGRHRQHDWLVTIEL